MTPSNHSPMNAYPNRAINGVRYSLPPPVSLKRSRSPNPVAGGPRGRDHVEDKDQDAEDERRQKLMKDLYNRSERMIAKLFDKSPQNCQPMDIDAPANGIQSTHPTSSSASLPVPPNRPARTIDEDDYGDDDEDDDDDAPQPPANQPKSAAPAALEHTPSKLHHLSARNTNTYSLERRPELSIGDRKKSSEDVRKKLEEDRKAAGDSAKENFLNTFYTLEHDRDAMLEQQRLDDLDRQVETEMSGPGSGDGSSGKQQRENQASLSKTNLGASSLTLKYLIKRIDAKRASVHASDNDLRTLMTEVRKNRSKWASEDRIGQEELYEPAERVLMELKSMTEYSQPFLSRVNKREVPDYHRIIHNPMDIGTMIKKLKQLQYRSKSEFCKDLDQIWTNCFTYNKKPDNILHKKAVHLKAEAAKLTPLIPEIVVRDKAEVDAEERQAARQVEEDSDDDEPIVATRGRKAPSKKSKKGVASARKAPPAPQESSTPVPEGKPNSSSLDVLGPSASHLRSDADSNADGSQYGTATPPPLAGNSTPQGAHGGLDGIGATSHADASEIDGMNTSMHGAASDQHEEQVEEDEDFKTWKQVTKKDRAAAVAERHKLFLHEERRINPEEPALLRTRAGMRRWIRQHQILRGDEEPAEFSASSQSNENATQQAGGTLAEGMDVDDEYTLPDYYDPVNGIPEINPRLRWTEDSEGFVVDHREECLRKVPDGLFVSPQSNLTSKMEGNMRQMQESRKVMAKIGIVKQMQLQAQTYQNQFQKYDPQPLKEVDIPPAVVSDDGPIMAPWVSRAALQRSVGKIFYHAGFEDFQPSSLEAVTDVAGQYIKNLVSTLGVYQESHRVPCAAESAGGVQPNQQASSHKQPTAVSAHKPRQYKERFTPEEQILHALNENGTDLESLVSYIEEDVSRLSNKLSTYHERIKDHLADLLRPALDPTQAGNDGAGAFNDGNESQFVAGDFAEDIDEDFFGFKELGLDRELGVSSLSVPLHLLQSRMQSAYQPANAAVPGTGAGNILEDPEPWEKITVENLEQQISLVQAFFSEKLGKTGQNPLVEDEELPLKQRFPKPRLPPNGKISSPRKRPLREQQMMARKKRKMEMEAERERERGESGANARSVSIATTVAGDVAAASGSAADAANSAPLKNSGEGNAKVDNAANSVDVLMTNGDGNAEVANQNATVKADSSTQGSEKENAVADKNNKRLKLDAPSKDGNSNQEVDPSKPLPNGETQQQQPNGASMDTGNSDSKDDDDGNGGGAENDKNKGMLNGGKGLQTIAAH